ncbi:GGDEF domain-containing phosphodiesterase [Eggerthella sinensis]|nr:GGDEF domain-containing phosphodiesterase [Eggerthella sinensis]
MIWNVSAEAIAFIIVLIISVYSRRSHAVPSRKNMLFRLCLITTIGAIGTNLASTLMIAYAPATLLPLTYIVTAVYFVLTPLLGTVYFYYAVAVVGEARAVRPWQIIVSAVPCALYALIVIANFATHCLFWFDGNGGYHQGPLILTTYLVFYFYCIACFALVVFTRAPIDPTIKRILAVFPLIAVVVIAVQQMFPAYLLSGSAATCSLLIIYLYLQNKRLSVDLLTGAPNRQEFLSMVALMHDKKRPFTALLVSLSNFKFINDKFGHDNGDRFLRAFAQFLETLGAGTRLYRYSGDQFALVVDEEEAQAGHGTDVAAVLDALHERLERPWRIGGHSFTMAAAVGVVSYPTIAQTPADVVAALEYAATEAKRLEPGTPCVCTPALMDAIHRRSTIADIVREAVANNGLSVHFQPIWSEKAKMFVTAEALCRLTDDELGPIPPDEFIPITEQIGLIPELTYAVLDQACSFVKAYRDAHPNTSFRGVSVNFSSVQFVQNDLAEKVLAIVERHGIPASCVRIEITETAIIANRDAVHAFMRTMNEHGVKFYLDDFGTGYSNVSTLLDLPIDVVKIDKSILWATSTDNDDTSFLRYLIACFSSIGSEVLSEGVETQEQRQFLARCGCSLMQGYLFARPMPPQDAAAYIAGSESWADQQGA